MRKTRFPGWRPVVRLLAGADILDVHLGALMGSRAEGGCVKLTAQAAFVVEVKNAWSCISTPPYSPSSCI